MAQPAYDLPSTLTIRTWHDESVTTGFGPYSEYVEYVWLGRLGPTATWLYRRLAIGLLTAETDFLTVDLVDLAVSLGIGETLGRNGKLAQSIFRLVNYGVAQWAESALELRPALTLVADSQLTRLSYSARLVHERQARSVCRKHL